MLKLVAKDWNADVRTKKITGPVEQPVLSAGYQYPALESATRGSVTMSIMV